MLTLDFRGMFAADSKAITASAVGTPRNQPGGSWKAIIEPIDPFLQSVSDRLTRQVTTFEPALAPYAEYALNGHGKHLRPALVALTANAVGKEVDDSHITVAVIIEMVHLATLVHDDIMDEAEIPNAVNHRGVYARVDYISDGERNKQTPFLRGGRKFP